MGMGSHVLMVIPKPCQKCNPRWTGQGIFQKNGPLFSVKPSSKSSIPLVKLVSSMEKGSCTIAILDELVDHSIALMASMLVGKFMGQRPNLDVVHSFTLRKWHLKGQVSVTVMEKGFLSFDFTCNEDMANILCEGPWRIGRATLVLQKWSSKLDLNKSFFQQAPVWVRLPELPLEFWN